MLKLMALATIAVSLPLQAEQCYTVESAQGSVTFEVKQAGSPFRGKFHRFGGEVCLSEDRPTSVEVWLDPASVDSGIPEIDTALKGREFLAVDRYPRVAYDSRSVVARGNAQLGHGTLQMKGKSHSLDVAFNLQRDGQGFIAIGTVRFNRLDYDVGTGEWSNTNWLGNEVKVDFRASLIRK